METNDLLRLGGWIRWPLRVLPNLNSSLILTCDALRGIWLPLCTAAPCTCSHSLPWGLALAVPFPSLRLQRWTSSADALLRCKLPSSLKHSALGGSLLAAISVPQQLPQEAVGTEQSPATISPCAMPSTFSSPWPQNTSRGLRCLPSITVPQVALSPLLLLLSCNSQESASQVAPVLRSCSCFQIKGAVDWQCLWLSETHWKCRVLRDCCRRGKEADKERQVFSWCQQHSSLFSLESFSEPCSVWPFTWAQKSDSRCCWPEGGEI